MPAVRTSEHLAAEVAGAPSGLELGPVSGSAAGTSGASGADRW
ncbi:MULTISPECIES: hypothetical protein [Mycobacteroides]|nr:MULTISPECIES: hypothetical protein [Mycobacteroides]